MKKIFPKRNTDNRESPKKGFSKKDSAKKEFPEKNFGKKEFSKKDFTKKDFPNKDYTRKTFSRKKNFIPKPEGWVEKYYVIYKPYEVLSQFTPEHGKKTLKDFYDFPKDAYPVGRLDADSEGLLILTNDKTLNNRLLNPKEKHTRTYLAQVEGEITNEAITQLHKGVSITLPEGKHKTLPAKVEMVNEPSLPERVPPVRFRKSVPTSFITLSLTEGKNRQVRKMTAVVGFPTLRLVRISIENLKLENMKPGQVVELEKSFIFEKLKLK